MRKNLQDSLPNDQKTAPRQRSDYSESGVDRTLIRWMLSLTPMERLLAVQEQVNAIQAMRAQRDPHLSLAKYLELKETTDRAKDQARLPVLRETLKLQNISSGQGSVWLLCEGTNALNSMSFLES